MKDVRIDREGNLRCFNCGQSSFIEKRTLRAKTLGVAAAGVGALLTHKKLKCRVCGEYNQTGNAQPYTGPADQKWRQLETPVQNPPVQDAVTQPIPVVAPPKPRTLKEAFRMGIEQGWKK